MPRWPRRGLVLAWVTTAPRRGDVDAARANGHLAGRDGERTFPYARRPMSENVVNSMPITVGSSTPS